MKKSTKRIGLIILIVVLSIIECLLCLGIALDGKYQVELSEALAAIETFYRDVTILEVFMFTRINHQFINRIKMIHNTSKTSLFSLIDYLIR